MGSSEWDVQRAEWSERVRLYGPERAASNVSNRTPEMVAAFDRVQREAVRPLLVAQREEGDTLALDYGCGTGRWSATLAALFGECVAMDPTPEIIAAACANSPGSSIRFLRMDGGRVPLADGAAGVVFSALVLNTILSESMLDATVRELGRVLRPGGLLFIVDLTWRPGPRRGRWSVARTSYEYVRAFAEVAPLRHLGEYRDGLEVHSILAGRKAR